MKPSAQKVKLPIIYFCEDQRGLNLRKSAGKSLPDESLKEGYALIGIAIS
jgi:hypothetical protein